MARAALNETDGLSPPTAEADAAPEEITPNEKLA
jgi:hypothetical protein